MPNKKRTMKKLLVNITKKEFDLIQKNSDDTGLSVSEILRRILDEYYEQKDLNIEGDYPPSRKGSLGPLYQFRELEETLILPLINADHVVEQISKEEKERMFPLSCFYFYFADIVNTFSSKGISLGNAEAIRDGLFKEKAIYVDGRTGNMLISDIGGMRGVTYSEAFKPFFKPIQEKPKIVVVPKNEEGIEVGKCSTGIPNQSSFILTTKDDPIPEVQEILKPQVHVIYADKP